MKKTILALAVLAFALPTLAQEDDIAGDYAQVAAGSPLSVPPGVYASTAKRLADFFAATKGARTLFSDQVKAKIAAGPTLLIDVRPKADYDAGHVPGAVNIPLDALFQPDNLASLPTDGTTIVLICATGHTESMALGGLVALGYQPYALRFGSMGWRANTPMKVGATYQSNQNILGAGEPMEKTQP